MQLNQIDLLGFRQLVNRSFEFKPGLNIVYGPNEAGKSTLMEAIAIMLYGFFDTGRISTKERDALNQNKPWSYTGAFGGTLKYQLNNGERFQIRRNFEPEISTSLMKLPEEKNLTAKFRVESDGRVYFAEEQFGISKPVFESIYVIRQSELTLLEQSAAPITETIMRLSSTMAAEGFTVKEALDLLDTTFKQKVGTTRANSKPLAMTKKRLDQLEKAINEAKSTRKQVWEKLASANSGKTDVSKLDNQSTEYQILLLKSKLNELTENLDRISSLQKEVDETKEKVTALQKWQEFRHDIYEELLSLDAKRVSFETDNSNTFQEISEKIDSLKKEQSQTQSQIENFKDVSPELAQAISAKKNEIEKAIQSLELAQNQVKKFQEEAEKAQADVELLRKEVTYVEKGHATLAKFQHQHEAIYKDLDKAKTDLELHTQAWKRANIEEPAFHALKDTPPDTPPKKGCRLLKNEANPADTIPSEIVIYNDLLPIYNSWKSSQASVEKVEQSKLELETTISREFSLEVKDIDSKTFEQASNKIDEYLKKVTASEVAIRNQKDSQVTLDEAQTLLKSLEMQLVEILPKGMQKDHDIQNDQQELQKLRQRLLDIDSQIDKHGEEEVKWQHKNEEHQRSLQYLQQLYNDAGIDEDLSLDEKLVHYKSERENYLAWQNANREAQSLEQRLKEFPFQSEKLTKQSTELQQQIQILVDKNPDASSLKPIESPDYYQNELDKVNQKIQEMKQGQIISANAASQSSQNMVDLASLLEEYAQVDSELNRLEWFGSGLQTAQNELTKASTTFQKQFAPRLQAYLNDGLSHATGGRYVESLVDPETLAVSLLAPETQRWIHVDQLSTGTKDLVYLLLRFSIARLMSGSVEQIPMLLDDPFVHCDRSRKANILSYLVNQSSDIQFILFTQDEWTLGWVNANHPACNKVIMSHDTNVSIDYTLVETLIDQSDAVRTRLLATEEPIEVIINPSDVEDPSLSSSALAKEDKEFDNASERTLQDISNILLSDETAIKIFRVFEQLSWIANEAVFEDALDGQFLNVILDRINQTSLDTLGDQLTYNDGEQLVVTEEYRMSLSHFLSQL